MIDVLISFSPKTIPALTWQALLLSGSESVSRGDLMRGLGAWYVNVQRTGPLNVMMDESSIPTLLDGTKMLKGVA